MKSRLVVYGRIQKGRPDRCLMVVLDERFCALESKEGDLPRQWSQWRKSQKIANT